MGDGSDRRSQYADHALQTRFGKYGMTCSMSRKGNCWDNAPTESFFNSYKNERVHGTRYAVQPLPAPSTTSSRSTIAGAGIPRSATPRHSSS
ncbi:MAG: DDE-type integrase/transposase/recombinase [Burkholderiales bacterium]|nr:DDE-type integrase/transposase/recombinase [Burkholderiales bacterium]